MAKCKEIDDFETIKNRQTLIDYQNLESIKILNL